MIQLEYPRNSGRIYTCARIVGRVVMVTAKPGAVNYSATAHADLAISWLCDRSLKRSKARWLVESCLEPSEVVYLP